MSMSLPEDVAPPEEISKVRWTGTRIARLGMLMGLGWNAERIAADPIIRSTPRNVHRQAGRFCLSFRAAAAMTLNLPPSAASHFDAAASARSVTREMLMRLLLLAIAAEPNLIDNIMDDRND